MKFWFNYSNMIFDCLSFQMLPLFCCHSGRLLIRVTSSRVPMCISSVTSKPIRLLNVSNGFIMCVYTLLLCNLLICILINVRTQMWHPGFSVSHILGLSRPNINYYSHKAHFLWYENISRSQPRSIVDTEHI